MEHPSLFISLFLKIFLMGVLYKVNTYITMLTKIGWNITRLICLYTLIAYVFGYFLRPNHWGIGFILLSIQLCLALCFVLVLIWLFNSKLRAFYPLAVLLLGFPFIKRTVQFNKPNPIGTKHDLSVLNYNVAGFNSQDYYSTKNPEKTIQSIHFAADFEADIKCFQDFYNWDETPITGSIKKISKRGKIYSVAARPKELNIDRQGNLGLIIFARYPLKYVKERMFDIQGNGVLVADMTYQNKTLRIINVQLQSTGARVGRVIKNEAFEGFKKESRNLVDNLKLGFIQRGDQINLLTKWINDSPHPVLLCGDFNEVPYGLAYGKVRAMLRNSFEEAGYGFGFTLNRSPRFVRIDNVFHSKQLITKSFETLTDVENSDHYPIYAELDF